jgi:hypothetical protein
MRTEAVSASGGDPASPPAAQAACILVLGMHRSGTSAIARVLNLRGAALGRELLPAKEDNERGFWENRAILELHERFLAQQGLSWHELVNLPPDWRQAPPAREFIARLPAALNEQFDGDRLFLVKDPRLSLLAPLWIEALAANAVRPTFVITVRHPNEVAASLARRDGFSTVQSHLLWLQHLVEAERATRGQARVFVHYERLLADWRGELERITRQLAIAWPPASADFEADATRFIEPALRHHRGSSTDGSLPALVERVYRCACDTATDAPANFAAFDAAAAGFDELIALAAPLQRALAERQTHEHNELAAQIDRARTNIDALATELAQARDAHTARDEREAAMRQALQALETEIARARDVYALKENELDAARHNIDALVTELGLARDNSHALAVEVAQARDAFASKEREVEAARTNIDTLATDVDNARAALSSKDREIDAARDNIGGLVAEIDRARGTIDGLATEIDRARSAHGLRDATEAALRSDADALRTELKVLHDSRWFRLGRALRLLGGPNR